VGGFAALSLISEGLTWLTKPESRTFARIALVLFFAMPFIAIGILVAVGFLYRKRNRKNGLTSEQIELNCNDREGKMNSE